MASPLILKIQAELERRGFDDVKRQIDRLKSAITGLGDEFQETEQKSRGFLKASLGGVVTALALLTAAGIVQERTLADLTNTFAGLGLDAESTADSIQDLTNSMVRNSAFGSSELRDSLAILTRSTRSLTLAENDSLIAQEVALRNNISLEQASRAVAAAHRGEGSALANLTELRQADIEAAQEQGTLRELLAEAIPIGESTERQLATISGAIEQFINRANAGFFALGEVVLEQVQEPLQGAIGFIQGATGVLNFFLDNTIFKGRLAAAQTELLRVEFEEIDRALKLIGQDGVTSFGDLEQALSDLNVLVLTLTKNEGELTSTQQEQLEGARRLIIQVTELQKTRRLLGRTSVEDQVRILQQLQLSREDFQRQELEGQLKVFKDLEDAGTLSGEEAIKNALLVSNAKIRLANFEKSVVVGNIEEEVDARRQLLALLQAPAEALDETASIQERGRALDRLVETRKQNLSQIEREKGAAEAALVLQADLEKFTKTEIEDRQKIINAIALAARLEVERATAAGAANIGDLGGRANVREAAERSITTLLREQDIQRRRLNNEDITAIRNTNTLVNLERDRQTILATGADITQDELDRLIRIKAEISRLQDDPDAAIPGDEEAAERFARDIERKIEIPDFNINFTLDRPTLIAEMREVIVTLLDERGFTAERQLVAPTGIDEEPS